MLARSGLAAALLLAALLCDARALAAAEPKQRPDDSCRSAGALKFDADQRPMQRSRLEVCSKYRKNTCCDASHAHALRLKIREPVVAKFSQQCQRYTEEMVCSSCHPFMGTWEMRNVCPRLCNEWYSACKDEFYSYSGSGSLSPCYGNALICSPLSSIANNGAEFCTKMGFHVGSGDDREGDECFDGSVPKQLGMAEPTEPWQQVLKRIIEEEMENPSAWFIAAVFVTIFTILVGYKSLKNLGDPFSAGQLSLDEVRRLQQERYARGELVYEEETDSSSSEEEGGLAQYIFQRVPRTAPTTPGTSGATPLSSGAIPAAGDATPAATDSAPTATTGAEEPEAH